METEHQEVYEESLEGERRAAGLFRYSKCGCVVGTAEEFEEHEKVSHPSRLSRLAMAVFSR